MGVPLTAALDEHVFRHLEASMRERNVRSFERRILNELAREAWTFAQELETKSMIEMAVPPTRPRTRVILDPPSRTESNHVPGMPLPGPSHIPPPPSEAKDPGELREMARMLAHVGVVHWRLWADLVYLNAFSDPLERGA